MYIWVRETPTKTICKEVLNFHWHKFYFQQNNYPIATWFGMWGEHSRQKMCAPSGVICVTSLASSLHTLSVPLSSPLTTKWGSHTDQCTTVGLPWNNIIKKSPLRLRFIAKEVSGLWSLPISILWVMMMNILYVPMAPLWWKTMGHFNGQWDYGPWPLPTQSLLGSLTESDFWIGHQEILVYLSIPKLDLIWL